MLRESRPSCLPTAMAAYMLAYAIVSRFDIVANWWTGTAVFGHPIPSSVVTATVWVQHVIFALWLLLSYFVWRAMAWARLFVGYSALLLGISQLVLYTDMLRLYGSASLIAEALRQALPALFLSVVAFCPTVATSFSRGQPDTGERI